jgi:fructose-bisphosphate aldolase class II
MRFQTLKPGAVTGNDLQNLFKIAKENQFAIPGVNIVSTNVLNAVLETAKAVNSPVIIQLSNGGAQFYAGKSLPNDKQQASVLGAVSAAKHVHTVAEFYGVSVVIHTDHAAKKLLLWIDGMLDAGEKHFAHA